MQIFERKLSKKHWLLRNFALLQTVNVATSVFNEPNYYALKTEKLCLVVRYLRVFSDFCIRKNREKLALLGFFDGFRTAYQETWGLEIVSVFLQKLLGKRNFQSFLCFFCIFLLEFFQKNCLENELLSEVFQSMAVWEP